MEPVRLWAAVEFTARSGSTEALLTAAARAGLHLYGVTALPGGFCGHCAARQYPRLAALARRYRVRLRVRKKQGLYFRVRPLLRVGWSGTSPQGPARKSAAKQGGTTEVQLPSLSGTSGRAGAFL